MQGNHLTLRHFVPLAGFVLPTAIMGYGIMIPQSCIAGVNELTVRFAGAIAGACVTYWVGLRALLREGSPADEG